MAKNAEFKIIINGLTESINAVDALNKQLDALEKRLDTLGKKSVSVSASGGGNRAALDEEAKLLQQIEQLHQKVAASEKAEYQELLHAKEELKEYQQIAKSIAAQTNLDQGINNTNTMAGMKAQLKDLKTAMQTIDVESDKFRQMQQEANTLNTRLKELEQGYGQFGRNVGNYANGVADGMQKIVIKVGDTAREFDNAREASRTLNMELKNMALNGEQNTQEYKDLNDAVKQMNSTLKDVETSSVAMDNLLDTMQGITALASAGQGLASLFGIDDSEIEKSIQKLVALQNVLQGIETIRKQMQTQEGIGMILSRGNKAVDSLVKSIVGVGTASKGATIAVKLLSGALKGLGIGLVIAAVSALVSKITDLIEKQQEAKKEAEELRKETNKNKASLETTRLEMQNTLKTLESFNGSKKEEERIVKDLNSKYGQALGTYKTIAQWKDALKQKTDAYIESLELEFEMQQAIKNLEDAYLKKKEVDQSDASDYWSFWNPFSWGNGAQNKKVAQAEADKAYNDAKEVVTNLKKKMDEHSKNNQINLYSPQDEKETKKKIKDNGKEIEKATEEAWKRINDARLYLMKDGLAKDLRQIDISYREEARAIRKGGVLVEEQLKLLDEKYAKQRKELFDKYSKELSLKETSAQIDKLEQDADRAARAIEKFNEVKGKQPELFDEKIISRYAKYIQSEDWNVSIRYDDILTQIKNGVPGAKKELIRLFNELYGEVISEEADDIDAEIDNITNMLEMKLYPTINIWRRYGNEMIEANYDVHRKMKLTLRDSLNSRLDLQDKFYNDGEKKFNEYNKNILEKQKEAIAKQKQLEKSAAEQERDSLLQKEFDITSGMSESQIAKIKENNKAIADNNTKIWGAYNAKINSIEIEYQSKIEDAEKDYLERSKSRNKEYFDERVRIFEEFKQKSERNLQLEPVYNDWGIFNLKKTRENYEKAKDEALFLQSGIAEALAKNEKKRSQGLISDEDANIVKDNLNAMATSVDETLDYIGKRQKESWKEWWGGINQWIQQIGQVATQVIQSIGEINDAAFQRQIEDIERQTDALEEQLEKQRELTQKYANDVESIEDELATARGDRRQHLIDQLNAQMAAQRESLAQEKRIEKEQERLDKKRERLEYENEMRKWNQSKATAAINAALAISNAAVNNWPIPAIPMMALATAVGAAQMAAVLANKPRKYSEGGMLEGKSHSQGGIKVLGGQAEVEGGEYVTNKRTTAQNLALLQFINKKKRKIDLSDMVDFYMNGANKNISNARKTYLADGGQLPMLRNDINISGKLVTTMEQYANRDVVVQVVDIINKADNLKNTQVLAGLAPKTL